MDNKPLKIQVNIKPALIQISVINKIDVNGRVTMTDAVFVQNIPYDDFIKIIDKYNNENK